MINGLDQPPISRAILVADGKQIRPRRRAKALPAASIALPRTRQRYINAPGNQLLPDWDRAGPGNGGRAGRRAQGSQPRPPAAVLISTRSCPLSSRCHTYSSSPCVTVSNFPPPPPHLPPTPYYINSQGSSIMSIRFFYFHNLMFDYRKLYII